MRRKPRALSRSGGIPSRPYIFAWIKPSCRVPVIAKSNRATTEVVLAPILLPPAKPIYATVVVLHAVVVGQGADPAAHGIQKSANRPTTATPAQRTQRPPPRGGGLARPPAPPRSLRRAS